MNWKPLKIALIVLLVLLTGCNLPLLQSDIEPVADAPTDIPTDTPTESPTAQPPVPIVYYYFVAIEDTSPPAGSVVILPDVLILGPTLSDIARSPD
ncbi:MAG: hypothetical protein MUO76_05440, partial [Anaerolineaceae bacterium]|nr:hypothetical protein [Anaerolineaceae bacterium]